MMGFSFCYILFLFNITLSAIIGNISLRRSKYTGWYEKFIDTSRLVLLIQNSIIFLVSALFCILIAFYKSNINASYIHVLVIILIIYAVIVINFSLFHCIRVLFQKRRNRMHRVKKQQISTFEEETTANAQNQTIEKENERDDSMQIDIESAEEITPRKILLRFLSFFSISFSICILVFVCFLSSSNTSDNCKKLPLIQMLFTDNTGILSDNALTLLIHFFLLMLTSFTGALLASVDMDYTRTYHTTVSDMERKKLVELSKRIRNR